MGCGACLSGLMPVLPEAVSTDVCGGAVAPKVICKGRGVLVLPETVSTDSRGGAVAPKVIGEERGVPVLPEAVSTGGGGARVCVCISRYICWYSCFYNCSIVQEMVVKSTNQCL